MYTWSLHATEKAFVQGFKWDTGVGELITYAGELTSDDQVGFFKAESIIQKDDQVVSASVRYDVKAVALRRFGGSTQFKVAVMKRLIE